jgi:hypothetical protein
MKLWNVLVPVVALTEAESAEEAIRRLSSQLQGAGFDIYDGDPQANAFESEAVPGPDSCTVCGSIDQAAYRHFTTDHAGIPQPEEKE